MRKQRNICIADVVVSNPTIAAITNMPFGQQIIFIQIPLRSIGCRAFRIAPIAGQLKLIVRIDGLRGCLETLIFELTL
jgi:hypothetical protein